MIFSDFIEELRQKEIEITFSDGKLKYSGPKEFITPDLIENLKKFKGKLIKHFWPRELGNLMPINPEGTRIPLFVIHGDNSNYLINEYFGPDQPVYGFFHPGSEGERIPFKNVEEMARIYRERIVAISPSGPYHLIGYSFGGLLAFEIAVQLQKAGNEVPFLVIIDSISPLATDPVKKYSNPFKTIRYNFLRPVRRKLKRERKMLECNLYLLLKKPIPFSKRSYYLWTKYLNLTNKYKPSRFHGKILLFRTSEHPSSAKYLGWETLADDFRLIEIDGRHLDIFIGKDRNDLLVKEIDKHLKESTGLN